MTHGLHQRIASGLYLLPVVPRSIAAKTAFESVYSWAKNDVEETFVEREPQLPSGVLSAISARATSFTLTLQTRRKEIVPKEAPLNVLLGPGRGVLDCAMVLAAAYCGHTGAAK